MENNKGYRISVDAIRNLDQPPEHHFSRSLVSRIAHDAKALLGNLSLRRLLFEDDHELGRALQTCFSSADICADQSAQAPLREHPRDQIIRAWRSRCQRVAFVANPRSALAALKDRFPRLGSLSQRLSTNTYRAGALAIVVLSLLLVGFAVEHAVSADHNRNNTAKSEQSNTTAGAQQNALIDESLVPGPPDVGPRVAESASQFDYTLAFILSDMSPMLFAENRNYGANSAIPQSGGAASASGSAVAQPLLASLGGVGGIGPSGVPAAPREVAVVPVPETGASSCLLLGLAFVLIYLTVRLLDAHSERRSG
jgi:hypothetical protein